MNDPMSGGGRPPKVFHVPAPPRGGGAAGTGLDEVRAEVRRFLAGDPGRDVEVRLAEGTYRLAEPLVLTAADSGRGGHRVTWTAEPGARPVLSGGVPLRGWRPVGGGRWLARVPDGVGAPRQLYVDGARAGWARGPLLDDEEYAVTSAGVTGPLAARVARWARPTDAEVVFRVRWRNFHLPVADASPAGLSFAEPCWTNSGAGTGRTGPWWDRTCVTTEVHQRYGYVANARELLDEPGHFVWDSADRTVLYLAADGQDMETAETVVPVAEELVVLDGAHDLELRGLRFAHTAWRLPGTGDGYAGMQAGLCLTGPSGPADRSGRFYTKPAAALRVRAGRAVAVTDCVFTGLGGAGARLESGTKHSSVTHCRFTDISSGALYVGDTDPHPLPEAADEGNLVAYNTVSGTGVEFTDAVGIWAGYTRDLTIRHNTLERLPYSGISVGWGWNQEEAQDPWLGGVRVEGNRITDVLMPQIRQFDGGAVYTQGPQPGTVVEGNYINRSEYPADAVDGNGIYLDEQSSHITVTGNVVTRVGYKWVSNWAEYGVGNHARGNWTDNTATPPFTGTGSTMTDNLTGLAELPAAALAVARQAGAGPWPAPVELLAPADGPTARAAVPDPDAHDEAHVEARQQAREQPRADVPAQPPAEAPAGGGSRVPPGGGEPAARA